VILIQSVIIIISFSLVSLIEFVEADAQEQNKVTNDTSALMEKGIALQTQGKYNESIGYYDKVIAIDPNHF
jgi:tetratricopeptide (TPR) repeat protein